MESWKKIVTHPNVHVLGGLHTATTLWQNVTNPSVQVFFLIVTIMEYLHEPFQNAQPMRRNVLNYSNHIDDALHAVLAKQEKDYDIPKGKK